jgi:hypothetical protein
MTVAFNTDTAAGTDGSITYLDRTALTVGTVAVGAGTPVSAANAKPSDIAAVTGIITVAGTTNGDVKVRAGTGDNALTVSKPIVTTAGTTDVASGAVVLEAGGTITLTSGAGAGTITTDSFGNAAAGDVFIHQLAGTTNTITLSNAISAKGGASGTANTLSDGGKVTVWNEQGAISLDGTIDVSKNAAGTNDGTIALKATGNISDTTLANLIGDTNGSLKAWSTGGKIALTQGATVAGTGATQLGNASVGHQMKTVAFNSPEDRRPSAGPVITSGSVTGAS